MDWCCKRREGLKFLVGAEVLCHQASMKMRFSIIILYENYKFTFDFEIY